MFRLRLLTKNTTFDMGPQLLLNQTKYAFRRHNVRDMLLSKPGFGDEALGTLKSHARL